MPDLPTLSERITRQAHTNQLDRAGKPYIAHLERVVGHLLRRWPDASEEEIAAAWLHNVLEDTLWGSGSLRAVGVPDDVILIVQEVSRRPTATYLHWIRDLATHGSLSAVRVKLADNDDNTDPVRVAALGADGVRMVEQRYAPARKLLLARLGVAEDG